MRFLLAASAAALILASPAIAQPASSSSPSGERDKTKSVEELHNEALAREAAGAWPGAPVEERTVSTRHTALVDGRSLPYTATAGTLAVRNDDGKPTA
ncbi:MAG TPA: peptidase S10, partial [Sphingomicrobium sp.]|nr:peptidase S10 [Sphingomicrobium sp.]